MSGSPISKESITDGILAHIGVHIGIDLDTADPDEINGLEHIAQAAVNYFSASVVGAPMNGAGQVLMWALASGLWEGKVNQEELNMFFDKVNVDITRIFKSWKEMTPEERMGEFSVVFVPGKLSDGDINDVARTLFINQKNAEAGA